MWRQRSPENVVASATKRQSEAFVDQTATLDVWMEEADFLRDGKRSRFEVYFGVPTEALVTVEADTGRLERGIAVFDTTWKVKHQMVDTLAYQKSDAAASGGLVVNQSVFDLLPGEYILGAQFKDLGSGGYGSQFKKINVEHYSGAELEISDIEVALEIFEDYQSAYKSGLQVTPNPTRIFDREKPVKIYYEIYGLSKGAFGQTHYQVDYHVSPMETEKRLVAKVAQSDRKSRQTGLEGNSDDHY